MEKMAFHVPQHHDCYGFTYVTSDTVTIHRARARKPQPPYGPILQPQKFITLSNVKRFHAAHIQTIAIAAW